MPVLQIPFRTLKKYGFQNCFIGDHDYTERMQGIVYEGHIHLLFRYQSPETKYPFKLNSSYMRFEHGLRQHDLYITDYIPEKGHAMFVFDFPDYEVIQNFVAGKYSKFPELYIKTYLKEGTDAYKVCTKDPEYWYEKWGNKLDVPYDPTLEVTVPPDIQKEIYKYKKDLCTIESSVL